MERTVPDRCAPARSDTCTSRVNDGARHCRPLAGLNRSLVYLRCPFVKSSLVRIVFPTKVILMRFRVRTGIGRERRKAHRQALILIITIACVPVLGTVWAVVSTTEPDLSDLVPSRKQVGGYTVLEWSELLQARRDGVNSVPAALSGSAVRALGYMMDGDKAVHTGDLIPAFLLLPEAGNVLHPAHRFGDQMISVRLREGDQASFSPRRLVWVWGTFRASSGDPSGPRPLYYLERAHVQIADRTDIGRYFQ